jgi:hypothetical protein
LFCFCMKNPGVHSCHWKWFYWVFVHPHEAHQGFLQFCQLFTSFCMSEMSV